MFFFNFYTLQKLLYTFPATQILKFVCLVHSDLGLSAHKVKYNVESLQFFISHTNICMLPERFRCVNVIIEVFCAIIVDLLPLVYFTVGVPFIIKCCYFDKRK